jgi:hypothetical protein
MITAENLATRYGPKPGSVPVDGGPYAGVLPRRRDAAGTCGLTEHDGRWRAHRTRFTGRMANAPATAQSPATVYSTL